MNWLRSLFTRKKKVVVRKKRVVLDRLMKRRLYVDGIINGYKTKDLSAKYNVSLTTVRKTIKTLKEQEG